MRKTKCKSCNGVGYPLFQQCKECQGTGEISVYTIQELREGKVWCKNDGTVEDLSKIFRHGPKGMFKYYTFSDKVTTGILGTDSLSPDIQSQSVKIFLEEIEQQEKKFCSGTHYCSLEASRNDDGTCGECGLQKHNQIEET